MARYVLLAAVIVVVFALGVTTLIRVFWVPEARVVNDLAVDVIITGCADQDKIDAGSPGAVRPLGSCYTFRDPGGYLGCLLFPDDAFTIGKEVTVSSMSAEVPLDDCLHQASYREHSKFDDFWDWVVPG